MMNCELGPLNASFGLNGGFLTNQLPTQRCLMPAGFISHFSHPHLLQQLQCNNQICQICNGPITDAVFGCTSCNFFIHQTCLSTPQKIRHKSHPHDLTLYSNFVFPIGDNPNCNACNNTGTTLKYYCSDCNFKLHAGCAGLPLSVTYDQKYPLYLNFNKSTTPLSCNACTKVISQEGMVYHNKNSGYHVHVACAVKGQKFFTKDVQKRLRRCQVK